VSGDVDGALPVPRSELVVPMGWCDHSGSGILSIPEEPIAECPPAPEITPQEGWSGVTTKLIHDALNEAMARNMARETEIATTAIKLGVGYARIESWAPMTYDSESITIANHLRVDYVITSLVPPLERFEFPNWSSFEVWRGQQEARRRG
jgi:hypothetical protein